MESMADILSMMRNQGINVEGFEAEAEDIWESLDNLSKKNPEEYRDFIRSQYENSLMSQKEQNGEVESTAQNNSTECDRFFRPIAGFAIKSKTSRGDGIKVRYEDDGKVIFINFCSHPAIEAPLDLNGHYVDTRDLYLKKSADGLKLRNVDDATLAVDVILNKSVIEKCIISTSEVTESTFKHQIIELASNWIEIDTGVVFSRLWTPFADHYSGGRGNDKRTPVLFPVSHATSQGNSKRDAESEDFLGSKIGDCSRGAPLSGSGVSSSVATGAVIQSPSSFLKALYNDPDHDLERHSEISIPNSSRSDARIPPKKNPPIAARLVMEVDSLNGQVPDTSQSSHSHREESAVKRGFLENIRKPLYENGSLGVEKCVAESLARVMEKCKVIDVTESSAVPLSSCNTCDSAGSSSNYCSSSGSSSGNKNKFHNVTEGFGSHDGDLRELDQKRGNNLILVNTLGTCTTCSYKTSLIRDRLCAWIQVEGISRDFFDLDTLDVQVSNDEVRISFSFCQHLTAPAEGSSGLLSLSGFDCPSLNKNAVEAKLSRKKKSLNIIVQYL